MAALTIRNLDDRTHARLRVRAAQNGRSMEAEVRAILDDLLATEGAAEAEDYGMGSRIHARFAAIGGWDWEPPARTDMPRFVDFDE